MGYGDDTNCTNYYSEFDDLIQEKEEGDTISGAELGDYFKVTNYREGGAVAGRWNEWMASRNEEDKQLVIKGGLLANLEFMDLHFWNCVFFKTRFGAGVSSALKFHSSELHNCKVGSFSKRNPENLFFQDSQLSGCDISGMEPGSEIELNNCDLDKVSIVNSHLANLVLKNVFARELELQNVNVIRFYWQATGNSLADKIFNILDDCSIKHTEIGELELLYVQATNTLWEDTHVYAGNFRNAFFYSDRYRNIEWENLSLESCVWQEIITRGSNVFRSIDLKNVRGFHAPQSETELLPEVDSAQLPEAIF